MLWSRASIQSAVAVPTGRDSAGALQETSVLSSALVNDAAITSHLSAAADLVYSFTNFSATPFIQ